MKTNELKACPFCGRNDRLIFEPLPGCTDVGNVACVCGASYTTITQGVDDWNTRPIEDGLRAEIETRDKRIAELEAEQQARWVMVSERLPEEEGWYYAGVLGRFGAHDATERQDDKPSNDTQTQTFVYGKEDSEVQE